MLLTCLELPAGWQPWILSPHRTPGPQERNYIARKEAERERRQLFDDALSKFKKGEVETVSAAPRVACGAAAGPPTPACSPRQHAPPANLAPPGPPATLQALIDFENVLSLEPKNYLGDDFSRVTQIYRVTQVGREGDDRYEFASSMLAQLHCCFSSCCLLAVHPAVRPWRAMAGAWRGEVVPRLQPPAAPPASAGPPATALQYNIACCYSMLDNTESGLEALNAALASGGS